MCKVSHQILPQIAPSETVAATSSASRVRLLTAVATRVMNYLATVSRASPEYTVEMTTAVVSIIVVGVLENPPTFAIVRRGSSWKPTENLASTWTNAASTTEDVLTIASTYPEIIIATAIRVRFCRRRL